MRQTVIKIERVSRVSKRQDVKLSVWAEIVKLRATKLRAKYGYVSDEWDGHPLHKWDGHHNDRDRNHNTLKNCRIVGRMSHRFITDNNIRDVPDLLSKAKAKPTKPDAEHYLAGFGHGMAYSKEAQTR